MFSINFDSSDTEQVVKSEVSGGDTASPLLHLLLLKIKQIESSETDELEAFIADVDTLPSDNDFDMSELGFYHGFTMYTDQELNNKIDKLWNTYSTMSKRGCFEAVKG